MNEQNDLDKLKKYWSKLYNTNKYKYNLKNLILNTMFYKDVNKMFKENPINLLIIENIMENIQPSKKKFDYYQKREFFEILKFLNHSKEFTKYQKHYEYCKNKNYDLKDFIEIVY